MQVTKILSTSIFILITAITSTAQNSGNSYFSSSQIHTIKITSSLTVDELYDSLIYYKDLANNTDDNTYMKVDVDVDGAVVSDIGIRMKGNSSYNIESKKKSLKLSFDEYVDDQEYDGMGTLNLNNCMWDPTLMREKVTLDFMRAFDVYAPRCTYANVYLNDTLWGLYSTVEQVDKKFLNTLIGENDGNLFKAGDDGGEFTWYSSNQSDYENIFQLKTNDSLNDWSDLVNLIDVVNNTPSSTYQTAVDAVFNIDAFTRYWALSNILTNLDSYLESTRNFYIYHNLLTDQFDWIAWDVNEAFGVYSAPNTDVYEYDLEKTNNRVLLEKFLSVTAYKEKYTDYLYELNSEYMGTGWLDDKIDSIYNVIKSSVYADTLKMFTNQNFEDDIDTVVTVSSPMNKSIPGLKEFIQKRFDSMDQQLMALGYPSLINEKAENANEIISVLPNPAKDYILLKANAYTKKMNINIYDYTGRMVLAKVVNNQEPINISYLSSGIYTYKITLSDKDTHTGKIIINK